MNCEHTGTTATWTLYLYSGTMKDWIMELCPKIAEWQAELIAEQVKKEVAAEREACAQACKDIPSGWVDDVWVPASERCAAAIRARGQE